MKRFVGTSSVFKTRRRVVVTGIGAITPLGNSFQSTWENITSGHADEDFGITSLENSLNIQQLPTKILENDQKISKILPSQVAAPVRNVPFDTRTSRFVQFALKAAGEAIQMSQLNKWLNLSEHAENSEANSVDDLTQYRRTRAGTCISSGMSSIREVVDAYRIVEDTNSIRRLNPHFVPKILCNAPSSRTSLEYSLQGPNLAPSTACAAGAHAIGEAMRCIQYDDADIMIAGGAESCIDPISMGGFSRLRALSTLYNDEPLTASRPFDKGRDGFVMGEGASILILEEMEHAKERGANILCELSGYGLSGDAFHVTSPDPDGKGAERAMLMGLKMAGIQPGEVDYVNAHATSTPMGDEIEEKTIHRVLCDESSRVSDLHVSSTKGATGHLLGAAGAIEAAFSVMSIVDGLAPPTKNLTITEDRSKRFFKHIECQNSLRKDIAVSVNNSFGFGGTNACLVFSAVP